MTRSDLLVDLRRGPIGEQVEGSERDGVEGEVGHHGEGVAAAVEGHAAGGVGGDAVGEGPGGRGEAVSLRHQCTKDRRTSALWQCVTQ